MGLSGIYYDLKLVKYIEKIMIISSYKDSVIFIVSVNIVLGHWIEFKNGSLIEKR